MIEQIRIYTDGACQGNPGPGGWAAIVQRDEGETDLAGHEDGTTNNRMEIMAAIKGLETTPESSMVTLYSDSQYLVNTMTRGWKRRANVDLWNRLDTLVAQRNVAWEWVRGHVGHPENERADKLATAMAGTSEKGSQLTHVDEQGRVRMVDVGWKSDTEREAVARGFVVMQRQTMGLIRKGEMEKGDVLSVARIAGIMGAKRTSELIPLCHPLPLDQVTVEMEMDERNSQVQITAMARTTSKTGVEMEALTAVTIAALTIYDMCKAIDRGIRIENIRLVRKRGGKSGDIVLEK